MELKEYLKQNGVKLMRNGWNKEHACVSRRPEDGACEVASLGGVDFVLGLDQVLGNEVYICDFRNGSDTFGKPVRAIRPMRVKILNADSAKKNIYYSPIFFREVRKDGKLKAAEISPVDNTGFRCHAGTSVKIFEDEASCVACYKEMLKNAIEARKVVLEEYKLGIEALEKEMNDLP